MTNQLSFNGKTLTPIIKDNQTWITSSDLSKALGYKSIDSVTKVYNRNRDEFTSCMTLTVNLTASHETQNPKYDTRVFSLRGCHLIAMFARTSVAKEFRKWVLDILDKEAKPELINPSIESIITELHLEPNMTRYLITVDGHGAKMQPMDVTGKSLVDAEAARNLVRDMNQMYQRMDEMVHRMGVLSGNCDVKRLDKRID